MSKDISNGRATQFDSPQKGVPFQLEQEVRGDIRWKIITGDLGSGTTVFRAKVNKLEQINLLFVRHGIVAGMIGLFEELAERISCQAQLHPGISLAPERLGCAAPRCARPS